MPKKVKKQDEQEEKEETKESPIVAALAARFRPGPVREGMSTTEWQEHVSNVEEEVEGKKDVKKTNYQVETSSGTAKSAPGKSMQEKALELGKKVMQTMQKKKASKRKPANLPKAAAAIRG